MGFLSKITGGADKKLLETGLPGRGIITEVKLTGTTIQTGNGLVNLVTPTSAVVMGGLAIAKVGYGTWLKFVWPLLIILAILSMFVMSAGVLLQ